MERIRSDLSSSETEDRALPERKLSSRVIGAFYDVYNEVGFGFLESVYSSALEILLKERGHVVEREKVFTVLFHGHVIGQYRADMIVDGRIVVENKSGTALPTSAQVQLQNYLRVSRIEVGLILHFGPKPEFKRVVFSRARSDQI
jgi:GxxExxY protein